MLLSSLVALTSLVGTPLLRGHSARAALSMSAETETSRAHVHLSALDAQAQLPDRRESLVKALEAQRIAVMRSELALAELDEALAPTKQTVLPTRGYLSRTAGCYSTPLESDGSSGPPPSAMTLALNNFGREIKELMGSVLPYQTASSTGVLEEPCVYTDALQSLTLSNDAIWAREHARVAVPAPAVIRLPYLALCTVLDTIFEGRPIARFWYLETVARIPYFSYNTMIFGYETLGWWRRSAKLKKVHFEEEWNEFHHLLIMESLGGDQAWFDRFIGQHSALAYYLVMTLMWLVSPTLAYNFSELIEAHAVDTYAEFLHANEEALRKLPPPEIALTYYQKTGGERGDEGGTPIYSLYEVFERIVDDEASHVHSMKECQDPTVRARARIVELGAVVTAAVILATSAITVETVETVEAVSAPLVAEVEHRMVQEINKEMKEAEERVGAAVEREEAAFESAFYKAANGQVSGSV